MRVSFFIMFFLCNALCFGNTVTLKEKLNQAETGSFLVVEQNKTFTLYYIQDKTESAVAIEEVSIPLERFRDSRMSWRMWFEQGAPGHSSWLISYVNLLNGQLEKAYSYTHRGWIDLSQGPPFLTTLLGLQFQQIPDSQRRRVGLPPGYGKPDRRAIWNPRVVVDGTPLAIPCSVWKARWPNDGSELARKLIEVYLPEAAGSTIPSFFPFWLEVEGRFGSAKIRVVDSGNSAISPHQKISLRMLGHQVKEDGSLVFFVESPKAYTNWLLIAEDSDAPLGSTQILPCIACHIKGHVYSLLIAKKTCDEQLSSQVHYRFSVSPKEDPSLMAVMEADLALNSL